MNHTKHNIEMCWYSIKHRLSIPSKSLTASLGGIISIGIYLLYQEQITIALFLILTGLGLIAWGTFQED